MSACTARIYKHVIVETRYCDVCKNNCKPHYKNEQASQKIHFHFNLISPFICHIIFLNFSIKQGITGPCAPANAMKSGTPASSRKRQNSPFLFPTPICAHARLCTRMGAPHRNDVTLTRRRFKMLKHFVLLQLVVLAVLSLLMAMMYNQLQGLKIEFQRGRNLDLQKTLPVTATGTGIESRVQLLETDTQQSKELLHDFIHSRAPPGCTNRQMHLYCKPHIKFLTYFIWL